MRPAGLQTLHTQRQFRDDGEQRFVEEFRESCFSNREILVLSFTAIMVSYLKKNVSPLIFR